MDRKLVRKARRSVPTKRELIERLGSGVRRMGAQSVLISQAVADKFGLHTTDLEVLDLIHLQDQVSAGELAQATGLTSGSVTALIDRLVNAGYVERQPDAKDRRRVLVRLRREATAPIEATYLPMQARMFQLWSTYSSEELQLINDFLARSTEAAVVCTEAIRRAAPPSVPVRRRRRQI
jgi:DNA-binding MarR family transcriptional regulator